MAHVIKKMKKDSFDEGYNKGKKGKSFKRIDREALLDQIALKELIYCDDSRWS